MNIESEVKSRFCRTLSEGRILVVGDKGIGKSWLCNALRSFIRVESIRPFVNQEYRPTYVVDVVDIGWLNKDISDVRVFLWDFAGGDEFLDVRRVMYTQGPTVFGVVVVISDGKLLDMADSMYKWKRDATEKLSESQRQSYFEFLGVIMPDGSREVNTENAPGDQKAEAPFPVTELDGTRCIDLRVDRHSDAKRFESSFMNLHKWVTASAEYVCEQLSEEALRKSAQVK